MIRQMKTMQDKVASMLKKYPATRDDDKILVTNFWYIEMKNKLLDPQIVTTVTFFQAYADGVISPADLITRARRKVQEENPELRGKTWDERHKEAEIFKNNIR